MKKQLMVYTCHRIVYCSAKMFLFVTESSSSDVNNELNKNLVSIKEYLRRIDNRLDLLQRKIDGNTSIKITPADDIIKILPFRDIRDVMEYEKEIKNNKDKQSMMVDVIKLMRVQLICVSFQRQYMINVGGTDAKNFITRCLQRTFTNELAAQCCWTGVDRGVKKNFKISNLKIIRVMSGRKLNNSSL